LFVFLFFFFQAEDGIRDFHVTGVQTCALPISAGTPPAAATTPLTCLNVTFRKSTARVHTCTSTTRAEANNKTDPSGLSSTSLPCSSIHHGRCEKTTAPCECAPQYACSPPGEKCLPKCGRTSESASTA